MDSSNRRVILREMLQEELRRRQLRNGRYSLRAFARDLNIAPTDLSQLLRGRIYVSLPTARRLLEALGLASAEIHERLVAMAVEYVDWLMAERQGHGGINAASGGDQESE